MPVNASKIPDYIYGKRLDDKQKQILASDVYKRQQEYYAQLTAFYQQFRRIGNNYNQCVKTIHTIYGEKKDVYKRQPHIPWMIPKILPAVSPGKPPLCQRPC